MSDISIFHPMLNRLISIGSLLNTLMILGQVEMIDENRYKVIEKEIYARI